MQGKEASEKGAEEQQLVGVKIRNRVCERNGLDQEVETVVLKVEVCECMSWWVQDFGYFGAMAMQGAERFMQYKNDLSIQERL